MVVSRKEKKEMTNPLSKIKNEYADYHKKEALEHRKYGDRVLLARQSKLGMMKLGGGNQASYLYPVDPDEREERLDGRKVRVSTFLSYEFSRKGGQAVCKGNRLVISWINKWLVMMSIKRRRRRERPQQVVEHIVYELRRACYTPWIY